MVESSILGKQQIFLYQDAKTSDFLLASLLTLHMENHQIKSQIMIYNYRKLGMVRNLSQLSSAQIVMT